MGRKKNKKSNQQKATEGNHSNTPNKTSPGTRPDNENKEKSVSKGPPKIDDERPSNDSSKPIPADEKGEMVTDVPQSAGTDQTEAQDKSMSGDSTGKSEEKDKSNDETDKVDTRDKIKALGKDKRELEKKINRQKEEIKILNEKLKESNESGKKEANVEEWTKKLQIVEKSKDDQLKLSESKVKDLQEKLHEQEETMRNLSAQMESYKDKVLKKEHHIEQLNSNCSSLNQRDLEKEQHIEQLNSDRSSLNRRVETLTEELTKCREEKESYKTRFSQVAGSKLTYNNENIVDLSDSNRPNKLAEKYSELYDNEWTDAYEEIEDKGEKEAVQDLLSIFQDCVEFCSNMGNTQKEKILAFFNKEYLMVTETQVADRSACNGAQENETCTEANYPQISEQHMKTLTDLRKSCGGFCIPEIQRVFSENYPKYDNMSSCMSSYIKKSLEVCWFAAIQEPPLYFHWDYIHDSEVITDFVTSYTKSGNRVDYVVWPTMMIVQGGSVLKKGVVQPISNKEKKSKRLNSTT